jgi:hypothetical protein
MPAYTGIRPKEGGTLMKQFTIIALLASSLWMHTANAQSPATERLQIVRVTGILVPYEAQSRDTFRTVSILVNDKPWLFRIGRAEGLTDGSDIMPDTTDEALLKDLRFTGPDALMRRLQKDNQLGRPLTLEGQLDAKERWFRVTAIEEAQDMLLPINATSPR